MVLIGDGDRTVEMAVIQRGIIEEQEATIERLQGELSAAKAATPTVRIVIEVGGANVDVNPQRGN